MGEAAANNPPITELIYTLAPHFLQVEGVHEPARDFAQNDMLN